MKDFTEFERYMLAQPVPSLNLPALTNATLVDLAERADIPLYGGHVPRGEENLRRLAMVVGTLPASAEEIRELELAGYRRKRETRAGSCRSSKSIQGHDSGKSNSSLGGRGT